MPGGKPSSILDPLRDFLHLVPGRSIKSLAFTHQPFLAEFDNQFLIDTVKEAFQVARAKVYGSMEFRPKVCYRHRHGLTVMEQSICISGFAMQESVDSILAEQKLLLQKLRSTWPGDIVAPSRTFDTWAAHSEE